MPRPGFTESSLVFTGAPRFPIFPCKGIRSSNLRSSQMTSQHITHNNNRQREKLINCRRKFMRGIYRNKAPRCETLHHTTRLFCLFTTIAFALGHFKLHRRILISRETATILEWNDFYFPATQLALLA